MQATSPVRPPAISVCIPNYNYAGYLAECIASVLAQDFSDFELLIQDDCSSDDWQAVVRQFQDARISVERNAARLGLVGNWNACIDRARGDFVLILHADDSLLPGILRAEREVLDANRNAGMVFSAVQLIDAEGHDLRLLRPFSSDRVFAGSEFVPLILAENFVRTPAVMVRRACYERLGGYNAQLGYTPDLEMWLRLAAAYDVAYLAQPYAAYREHTRNATRDFQRDAADLREEARAFEIFFRAHPEFIALKSAAYEALTTRATEQIKTSLLAGDTARAIAYAQVAAEARTKAGGPMVPSDDVALVLMAQSAANLVRSHKELERWALELEQELKRRDTSSRGALSRLRKALGERPQ